MRTMTSQSPFSSLFTQPFIQAQIKENINVRVTGLYAGNSPMTGVFPEKMASNAENVSISWRHHVYEMKMRSIYLSNIYNLLVKGFLVKIS